MAKGGRRAGAGRKKAAATILKELAIEAAHGEAEKSLQFMVELRDNEKADMGLRKAAADSIMDRVWGKPKQAVDLTSKGKSVAGLIEAALDKAPNPTA